MALDAKIKELLLKTLEDLEEEDFKKFKLYTHLLKSKRENADQIRIAEELVNRHGRDAVAETITILEKINNNELAEKLRSDMLQIKDVTCAPSDSTSLPVQIGEFKRELQKNLRVMYCKAPEGKTEPSRQETLESVYTKLQISCGVAGLPDKQHEVLQMETCGGEDEEEESIEPCDIFKSETPLRTMVTVGFAGIGKTFLVRKFVLDWANGGTNTDVDFIFPFAFRELNLEEKNFSLAELIQHFICDSKAAVEMLKDILVRLQDLGKRTYQSSDVKILFVLDGLDECRLKLDLSDERKERLDVTRAYPVEVLLAHLIKGNLLPCARLWITTRPQAARDIPSRLVDGRTEVKGFSRSQRLDYFRKKFSNEDVIKHIQTSRSIFIMCHMPIFCWLTATVLGDYRKRGEKLPETLTEMYTEFLLYHLDKSEERSKKKSTEYVKALAELAFRHLMKKQQIFYESDLRESGLGDLQVAKHSGVFTEVFEEVPPLKKYQRGKMFQFIHLSIQEYLAALYVMMSLFQDNKNVLGELPMRCEQTSLIRVHEAAIRKASESDGNLDLFIRFLVGLSLQCNQELMGELLKAPKNFSHSNAETIRLIEQQIDKNSPEENINLFYCLKELKDESLLDQMKKYLEEFRFRFDNVPPAMWSALVFFLLASDETMSCFELRRYAPSDEGLLMLLPVVKASRKSVLESCNLSEKSGEALASVLSSSRTLRQLDLSRNNLGDDGLEALAAGLAKSQCTLQVLALRRCNLSEKSCEVLASVLSLSRTLRQLDLSRNNLGDDGLEALAAGLAKPQCTLQVLRLSHGKLSKKSCNALASVLSSCCSLRKLDLSWNDLGDDGLEALAAGLAKPQCTLQVLELENCNLSEKSGEALASVLSSSRTLRELDLSHNDLGDDGLEALAAGLAKPQCTLQVLKLLRCDLSKKSCEALASVLSSSRTLRELDLSNNDLGDDGLEALAAGLAKSQCTLQVLKLMSCDLSKKSCEALASVLSSSRTLRELDLSHNDLGDDGLEALAAGLAKPQCTLQVLTLESCNLSEKSGEALASVLSSSRTLRKLDLSDNYLGDDGLEALAAGLANPQCTLQVLNLMTGDLRKKSCEALASVLSSSRTLRELDLSDNDLGDDGLEALAAGLAKPQCTLQVLKLNSCKLSKKSCEALASVLSSSRTLRELDLSWNDLGDDGLEALAAGLAKPQCTLQVLRLDECKLSKKSCDALASVLSSSCSLRKLDLSNNDLGDDGLEALAAGLAKPQCTLQVLRLNSCNLSEKSCDALASVLSSSCSLRKLDLSWNDLGDDGLEALAAGLAKPQCTFQVLGLNSCKLSKKSCDALASVLSSSCSLRKLDLSWNDLGDDGLEALAAGLAKPQCTLQVLELVGCDLRKKSCEALAKALQDNPSHLQKLDLWRNRIEEEGMWVLAEVQKDPRCSLRIKWPAVMRRKEAPRERLKLFIEEPASKWEEVL
nr:NACHT, LRR and PYD domains-containing protein 12 isoform X4 [Syngnathus scovelli]